MAIATVAQMRAYLPQTQDTQNNRTLLQSILERATAILEMEIGVSLQDAGERSEVIYGDGSNILVLPPYVEGSVTAVTAPSGYSAPDYYVEKDGALVVASSEDGPIGAWPYPAGTWRQGVPYTVTATFGIRRGASQDLVQACLELAVEIWRGREAGFSGAVGVDGAGALVVPPTYPPRVMRVIKKYHAMYNPLRIA